MFLEKINNFQDESVRLKNLYASRCETCNGDGLVKKDNGYVTCNCVKKANIQARLICNGLPKKYINMSWDSIPNVEDDSQNITKLKSYCENIDMNIWEGKNLFLNSLDKNKIMMIEAAMCNDIAYKKNEDGCFYNILIVSAEELMQTQYSAKNNFEVKSKLNKVVNGVDILILNYLGEETDNRTDNTSKYINDLIVKRGFDSKLTIISSSLDMEAIANRYGINFITSIKQNFKPVKLQNATESLEKVGVESNGYY